MNKIIAALIGLTLLATPCLASTDIRSSLLANGMTQYASVATVSGYDWSEGSWQTTAVVKEYVNNDEHVEIVSQVVNPGEWILQEGKYVEGYGDTEIDKLVAWWTEDSTIDCCSGLMKWPTETSIFVQFSTDTLLDQEEVFNIANEPVEGNSGEFSYSQFLKNIVTSDEFQYLESVGIGTGLDCTPIAPVPFPTPDCDSGFC